MDEGASSYITDVGSGWVRKKQKAAARKAKRNSIEVQRRLQSWTAEHLTLTAGYTHLFSPACRECPEPHAYEMQRIDAVGDPWFLQTLPEAYKEELIKFRAAFTAGTGYELYDVEFFPQPDGRVAVVDFDQCRIVRS